MPKPRLFIAVFLALISSFAFSLRAEDKPNTDIIAGLKRGERVNIILKNNISYTGIIKSVISDRIEIDISYDDPVLKGSFSFRARDIKSIIARSTLSKAEKERIIAEKEKKDQERARELAPKTPAEDETAGPAGPAEKKELDDDELLGLLDKFPRGEKWNSKTYQSITGKDAFLRTPEEISFMENYQNWLKALELKEKNANLEFFKKYLPENGWGDEKYTELITKYIRLKVGLSAEEQEFVDKYETWKKTRIIYEAEQKKKQEEEKKKEEEKKTEPAPQPAEEEKPAYEQPPEEPAKE
ncbi:MAG: hypothetical protein AB1599_02550 [Planctomycetota bacterium]